MKGYQYPVPRRQGVKPAERRPEVGRVGGAAAETPGPVQGVTPGSLEEWRVAVALDRLKIAFRYQVPVNGGRLLRGGQVVDFVVYNPFAQPVEVKGEHWHLGALGVDDPLKDQIEAMIYGRLPIILWAVELQTLEMAYQTVRRKIL